MNTPLKLEALTAAAFATFGDVIEARHGEFHYLHDGMVERYHDLAHVDALALEGKVGISLMRAKPYAFPLTVAFLERHPLSSQAFIPLNSTRFIVVVARPGDTVDSSSVRAFLSQPGQGVNYAPGVWHHVLLATEVCDFLVVDRIGPGPNCDKFVFSQSTQLVIPAPAQAVLETAVSGMAM